MNGGRSYRMCFAGIFKGFSWKRRKVLESTWIHEISTDFKWTWIFLGSLEVFFCFSHCCWLSCILKPLILSLFKRFQAFSWQFSRVLRIFLSNLMKCRGILSNLMECSELTQESTGFSRNLRNSFNFHAKQPVDCSRKSMNLSRKSFVEISSNCHVIRWIW